MSTFDDTTVNGWLGQPGPINLRRSERRPDPIGGSGIVLAALCGACLLIWAYDVWILLR